MLLPTGGGDGLASGPPTEWALSMRKWSIALWLLLLALLIGKVIVLDIFGVFSLLIVVVIGYFVPFGKPPMQQRWIIFWGLMCAFNCILDLIFGVLHLVQYMNGTYRNYDNMYYYGNGYYSPASGNQGGAPPMRREPTPMEKWMMKTAFYAVVIGLMVPLVEALVAWLCWALYKDHPQESEGGDWGGAGVGYGAPSYGASGGGGGGVYRQGGGHHGRGNASAPHRNSGFQPFQGGGARLGNG